MLVRDTLIAVTGATGKQGGAVAQHLLKAGFSVRALTRNPAGTAARRLKEQGADVVFADMEDRASLDKALDGAYGVFSVQNFWEKGVGYDGEVRQGRNLADAAKQAKVSHFLQASVVDSDKAPGVKHWECKAQIEKYIQEIDLPRTILRETFFMENFLDPKYGSMMFPFIGGVLRPETRLHMLCVEDVGGIAAVIFQHSERFLGKAINAASDQLAVREMKDVYARVTGRSAKGFVVPPWLSRFLNLDMVKQLKWNNDPGWEFELDDVRAAYPKLTTFEAFLERHSHLKL